MRLADRLAVVPALRDRDLLEVLLDPVGDLVQDHRSFGGGRSSPRPARPHGRRPGRGRHLSAVERATSQNTWPLTGEMFSKYWPLTGANTLATDPIVVTGFETDHTARLAGWDVNGHSTSLSSWSGPATEPH